MTANGWIRPRSPSGNLLVKPCHCLSQNPTLGSMSSDRRSPWVTFPWRSSIISLLILTSGLKPMPLNSMYTRHRPVCSTSALLPPWRLETLCSLNAVNCLTTLNEVVTGAERVLDTPMPAAYAISIAQITWIYVLVLPFQLFDTLSWVTIPGSIGIAPFPMVYPTSSNILQRPHISF